MLVEIVEFLLVALVGIGVLVVQARGEVGVLVEHLALVCKVLIDLLRIANDSLLVGVLRQIFEVLLLLL